jgi:hypothetical protein
MADINKSLKSGIPLADRTAIDHMETFVEKEINLEGRRFIVPDRDGLLDRTAPAEQRLQHAPVEPLARTVESRRQREAELISAAVHSRYVHGAPVTRIARAFKQGRIGSIGFVAIWIVLGGPCLLIGWNLIALGLRQWHDPGLSTGTHIMRLIGMILAEGFPAFGLLLLLQGTLDRWLRFTGKDQTAD